MVISRKLIARAAVTRLGIGRWKQIAKMVPQRDATQCSQHWKKVLDPKLIKGFWTPEEDQRLVLLKSRWTVSAVGRKLQSKEPSWSEVAEQFHGRSAKQCRERWNNSLNPNLKKGRFSQEEDRLLMAGWKKYGTRWNLIVSTLPGRTQTKIRDRFKTLRLRNKEPVEKWERQYGNRGSEGAKKPPVVKEIPKPSKQPKLQTVKAGTRAAVKTLMSLNLEGKRRKTHGLLRKPGCREKKRPIKSFVALLGD